LQNYLLNELRLNLHEDKLVIRPIASGVDFLGWVHFTDHRVLRTKTKKRMLRNIGEKRRLKSLQSYLGLLEYGNTYGLKSTLLSRFFDDFIF
jgi:hypothetical protein